MICRWVTFVLRITHIPTGLSIQTDAERSKTVGRAKERVMKVLKSKLFGRNKTFNFFEYNLPDDLPNPNELLEHRKRS